MQDLNRATISYITSLIKPSMPLSKIKCLCEEYLLSNGADSFWYYDVGAFVFSGESTKFSFSGKNYTVEDTIIKQNDVITIDLSPQKDNIWGDYARTIILENGLVVKNTSLIQNEEWKSAMLFEIYLHKELVSFVTKDTSFEDLFYHMNDIISKSGYVNLDFSKNLGHSIVKNKNYRIYIEKGNKTKLIEVDAFTFEPHIAQNNSVYGFKHENIYTFENSLIVEV